MRGVFKAESSILRRILSANVKGRVLPKEGVRKERMSSFYGVRDSVTRMEASRGLLPLREEVCEKDFQEEVITRKVGIASVLKALR